MGGVWDSGSDSPPSLTFLQLLPEDNNPFSCFACTNMEKAKDAVESIVDGVKKVAVGGKEKKPKVKKEKSGGGGGDGGADAVCTFQDFPHGIVLTFG